MAVFLQKMNSSMAPLTQIMLLTVITLALGIMPLKQRAMNQTKDGFLQETYMPKMAICVNQFLRL